MGGYPACDFADWWSLIFRPLAFQPMAPQAQSGSSFSSGNRSDEADLPVLMMGYQRGDAAAVDQLIARVSPPLWRFFDSNSRSSADAEDLLQECWIRIHKARHTYRPSEPLMPWVFAIARYTKLDGYRKRRRRDSRETQVEVLPEIGVEEPPPAEDADARFRRLLAHLPESQREVILMLKVSDMSLEEVARATSSTVGSIKQKAHRAYEKLRQVIETEGV